MDYKKVLKILLFAVIVPGGSALIVYHGVQFGKKKFDQWKNKNEETKKSNSDIK